MSLHPRTVFIIDDDPSVRDAVSLLLSLHGHATASFSKAEDFLSALQPHWRGCLVLDLHMPGMGGLALQERLLEMGRSLPAVVVTAHGDVATARKAFLAHAADFLEKPFDAQLLLQAVERALDKGARDARDTQDAKEAPQALASAGTGPKGPSGAQRLSPREQEVMQLLVRGLDNRRIARELDISHRTVEVHKARVLEKLGASSVVELVRLTQT